MKEHPILFSAPMVRAILEGRKTQTRRIVRLPKGAEVDGHGENKTALFCSRSNQPTGTSVVRCPFGSAGDRLWVRETWGDADGYYQDHENEVPFVTCYRADLSALSHTVPPKPVPAWDIKSWNWSKQKWRPSIHMPRWASRLLLDVVSVRVERLQDITEEDAKAEGVESPDTEREEHDWSICEQCGGTLLYAGFDANLGAIFDCDCTRCDTHRKRFRNFWKRINGERADWESNPWVWRVEFHRTESQQFP
jgi:hypothetical protein